MASATKQIDTVKTVKTVETVTGVNLYLTLEEARTLAVVMSRVGGSPRISPREHVASVSDALHGAGIRWQDASERSLLSDAHGFRSNIIFSDYPVVEG